MNNNYIQTSSIAFDYARFPNKLSGVSQEREIERLGFLRICIRKYTFVMIRHVNILTYANLGRPQLSSSNEKKPFLKTLIGIGKNKKLENYSN